MLERRRRTAISVGLGVVLASLAWASLDWTPSASGSVVSLGAGSVVEKAAEGRAEAATDPGVLILADPDDAYYELAREMAATEGCPILHTWQDMLARDPATVLWVVSPHGLSEQDFAKLGLMRTKREAPLSLGIITGSSMEQARQLWLRSDEVSGRLVVTANAANPSGHIQSKIVVRDPEKTTVCPLTLANLRPYLQQADYFTFTGHGGPAYLRLDEATVLRARDVPDLPPMVVATASCNTLRFWKEDSIALAFLEKGAAAYAGFAYSPNEGYLLGEFDGAPWRYTWPGFPIGHVVEIQSRGALKGFAHIPYYYLLGDPRIALREEPPYALVEDTEEAGARRLRYEGAPEGFIPLRIPEGAWYSFVRIPGLTSSWESDPFYNSRLEMVDFGDDKYILFEHAGGAFEVLLQDRPPWYWPALDFLVDSLDHTLVYLPQTGGDLIALFTGGVAWLTLLRLLRRTRRVGVYLVASLLTAALVACLQAGYGLARLGDVTITSKMLALNPLALLGTFLVTAPGALLFLSSRSRIPRAMGLVVATAPTWASIAFSFALVAFIDLLYVHEVGAGIYNHALAILPLGTLLVQVCVFLLLFSTARAVVEKVRERHGAGEAEAAL
jgi:hypothetical protein